MKFYSILVVLLLTETTKPCLALSVTTPRPSITPPGRVSETMQLATKTSANRFLRAGVSPKGFNAVGVDQPQWMDEERGLSNLPKTLKEKLHQILSGNPPMLIQEFHDVLVNIIRRAN
ncbi:RxLR effector protein [Phytophthora megakarya]|uniref:RxLR effector protein n=1 Tax=Phytophthora megakarya TaxID=4795 RepID=A0A225VN30_9STRA|nr:RxLR effector protein [Phytophthora megakarya]